MADTQTTTKKQKRSLLQVLLSSGLIATLSTALVAYINSSFLETLVPKSSVGLVFSIAYVVTFFSMQNYALIIKKFGNHNVTLGVFFIEFVSLLLLAWNIHPIISLLSFIILVASTSVAVINFDLFLEELSTDAETGRIRGMFWTAVNLGFLLGPFISGVLSQKFGFSVAYLVAALVLIPAWLLIFFAYKHKDKHVYKKHHALFKTLKKVHRSRDLRGIFFIAGILYLFYSWMVIYTPIYLLESGYTWEQIGVMFTIMLIPFVIIEYPAGWLADKYLGETELLTLGFAIMGISIFALLLSTTYWPVLLALFFSRVGASLVEIMRDTYFYKQVNEEDLDLVDLFRNVRSIAYIIGPLIASALLAVGVGLKGIFISLALILFASTILPFLIKDTK